MRLTLESLPMYCVEEGDCLLWALGTNGPGYPQAQLDGKVWMVRRYVHSVLMQRPLAAHQPVATSCGHKLCLNPAHIHGSNHKQVLSRAYRQGMRNTEREYAGRLRRSRVTGWAKMTDEQLRQIREAPEDETNVALAARLGLGRRAVSDARAGRSWREHAAAASVFSWAQGGGR